MNEQAKSIIVPGLVVPGEQAARELPRLAAPLVYVTGGKGGVGKSQVCLNLACELGKRGRRVLLVDLDLGLGNLAVMLKKSTPASLEDYLDGKASIEDCRTSLGAEGPRGPHGAGAVDLLAGSAGSRELARPDSARRARLFDGLRSLAPAYDLVLCDGAAGIGPDVLAFAGAADSVLAIATPEPASVTDVYGILKAISAWSESAGVEVPTPGLVLNRVSGPAEATSLVARLSQVTRRFLSRSPRLVGWVPESRSVREAVQAQRAFVQSAPRCLASQCMSRLAARIEAVCGLGKARLEA